MAKKLALSSGRCARALLDDDLGPLALNAEQRLEDQLYLAASALAAEAQRTIDPEQRRFLMQTARRVIAAGRVEARLRTLDLADQARVTAALPEICAEMWACLDGVAPPTADHSLAALAAAAIAGCEGIVDAARDVSEQMGEICMRLDHDGRGVRRLTLANGAVVVEPEDGADQEGPGMRLLRALASHFGAAAGEPVRGTSISLLLV